MSSIPTVDVQQKLDALRNKQIEFADRLAQLEAQLPQLAERIGKLEEITLRLEKSLPDGRSYRR